MSRLLLPYNNRNWSVIAEEDPNFFKSRSRSRSRGATQEAINFGKGIVKYKVAPKCSRGATCNRNNCDKFHGSKECNFAAGKMINRRPRLAGGRKNPDLGKPMKCGKGSQCQFNHRSVTRKQRTEQHRYETARKEQAPSIETKADLLAAYPSLGSEGGATFTTGGMTPLDHACLLLSLKKSNVEHEESGNSIKIHLSERTRKLESESNLFNKFPTLDYLAASSYSTKNMSQKNKEKLVRSLNKSGYRYKEHGDFINIDF
jgi:hypothetical protein